MDADFINELYREDRPYYAWLRERKNHILAMVDTGNKQRAWNELFPKREQDDEWLLGGIY